MLEQKILRKNKNLIVKQLVKEYKEQMIKDKDEM